MLTIKYRELPSERDRRLKREKYEKDVKRAKKSTTVAYLIIWAIVLGDIFMGPFRLELIYVSAALMIILASINAFYKGFRKTRTLPIGYGLGAWALVVSVVLIHTGGDLSKIDYGVFLAVSDIKMWIVWGLAWAAPAFVGVIIGSVLGIGYRSKYAD